jgi:hypothetical protein
MLERAELTRVVVADVGLAERLVASAKRHLPSAERWLMRIPSWLTLRFMTPSVRRLRRCCRLKDLRPTTAGAHLASSTSSPVRVVDGKAVVACGTHSYHPAPS